MNSIALEQVLPPESLPTFTVRKIANISGVFSNPYLSIGEEKLREYAVAVEDSRTKFEYVGEPILIHAERYGGTGIGTHGGGVRCGYLNGWQVKGSGQNLLSGHDVEFWHSHGALAQVEAFYEALWGEALSVILPFGAIRSPGIILTDGISWQKDKNGAPVEVPRGLLVREAGVRPAHFERAYRFSHLRHKDLPHDTDRTIAAIKQVLKALPQPRGLTVEQWQEKSKGEQLTYGIAELCTRMAAQGARARARRIIHGAPGSSNVCTDGRWIDYDTTTLLSCYANVVTGNMQKPFWQEHLNFYYIIDELCFYISKYSELPEDQLPQAINLKRHYFSQFEQYLALEFLALTGLPYTAIHKLMSHPQSHLLAKLLLSLAQSGHQHISDKIADDQNKTGDYDLNALMLDCARAEDLSLAVAKHIEDNQLRQQFVDLYSFFQDQIISSSPNPKGLKKQAIMRCAKRNKNLAMLYRHHAFESLNQIISRFSNSEQRIEKYKRLFCQTIDEVNVLYYESMTASELVWQQGDSKLYFDSEYASWQVHRQGQLIESISSEQLLNDPHFFDVSIAAEQWWGQELWEEFVC